MSSDDLAVLRAALATAHDHLHAGRVNEAHEALHCGISGEATHPPNINLDEAARLQQFAHKFNRLAARFNVNACWVALIPSATKEGYVSEQIGGCVPVIQHLRARMGLEPTRTAR